MSPFAYPILQSAIPLAGIAVIVLGVTWWRARRHEDPATARRWLARAALAVWMAALLWWTLGIANPSESGSNRINLTPFEEIIRAWESSTPGYTALNLVGNMVVFVPVGLLLVLSRVRTRGWPVLSWLIGTAFSASIETAQYAVGRAADIDDVILNSVGVAVGVLLALVMRASYQAGQKASDSMNSSNSSGQVGLTSRS